MDYKDITNELCNKCGECCKVVAPVQGNERYFEFLNATGLKVTRDKSNPMT